ncbi:SMC family ATPase [Salinicoccus jeotgali]|uniref:Nuclease SbcCD subunit C n=1 Tax=Salinicoccus jeotgali TaxID=381634 RepID=A0ABP7ED58_9STAP
MKPIQISMHYFGPFENETIDFTKVKDSMFLISGRTGSGKTMIFDAITYALYGTLSTRDRTEGSVRSQFATDDDISSIRLQFEIRGRTYTVERTLSYHKAGRKTPVPPKAVLYSSEGDVIDSSINGVKQSIMDIIKLDADQFRQILVLPQGEFKRLLTSSSEQKQEILRTLFRTERFVQFENKLNELKKEKLKDTAVMETKIQELFNSLSGDEHAAVRNLMEADYPTSAKRVEAINQIQNLLAEKLEAVGTETTSHQKSFETVKKVLDDKELHNTRVKELQEIEDGLNKLESRKTEMEELEKSLADYRIAKEKEYALKKESEALAEKKRLDLSLQELVEAQHASQKKYEDHLAEYEELKAAEGRYSEIEKWLNRTERFMSDDHIREDISGIEELQKAKTDIEQESKKLARQMEELKVRMQEDAWDRAASDRLARAAFENEKERMALDTAIKEEQDNRRNDEEVIKIDDELLQLEKQSKETKESLERLKRSVQDKFSTEDGHHISHLLEHLEVGHDCPVCRQPVQTLPHNVETLTDDEEKRLNDFNDTLQRLAGRQAELQAKRRLLEEMTADKERTDLAVLQRTYEELETDYQQLTQNQQADSAKYRRQSEYNEQYKRLEQKLTDGRVNENNITHQLNRAQELKDTFTKETGYEQFEAFVQAFKEKRREVEGHRDRLHQNETVRLATKDELARMEEKAAALNGQAEKAEQTLSSLTPEIDRFTHEVSMSREELISISERTDISKIEAAIKSYHREKEVALDRKRHLENQMEGREWVDPSKEQEELAVIEKDLESLMEGRAKLNAQIEHNNKNLDRINGLIEQHEAALEETQALLSLADAVAGRNDQKVSLERFVLTYYLDRILQIANIRLLEMTGHRYELRRSTSRSNRKTGLDIEVFDFYNNQPRHISSLSGGESFQAALTLALALNEALQQESGGISLETMLIDEGFGTLDPETLDVAVNTLIDLQTTGKMVGIISHVEELKTRMEHILEVDAANERSVTRFK